MGSNEVDLSWVAALARHLVEESYGESHGPFDTWELSTELLLGQRNWLNAAQQVVARRDQARDIVAELRRFTVSVALHSLDTAILGMPAIGSGEYGEGYLRGLRACRSELSRYLRRPPAPRPDTVDVLAQLRHPAPPPPTVPAVRDNVDQVLQQTQTAWSAAERAAAADKLGNHLARFAATALKQARRDLKTLYRQGVQLLDALHAPGDLHITEPVTGQELTGRLRTFAAAVRQDATPGRTFAAGFYIASEHVARMSEQRATDLRFPRGQTTP